jgi:hypothetical protein
LAFFVFGEQAIYYANELKPYATDLLMMLVLYQGYFSVKSRRLNLRDALWLGIMGWVAVWVSYSSLFVLASLAGGLLLKIWPAFFQKSVSVRRGENVPALILLLIWGWSMGQAYFLAVAPAANNVELHGQWTAAFMPRPVWSARALHWAGQSWANYFINPLGLSSPWIAVIFIGWGTYVMSRKNRCPPRRTSPENAEAKEVVFLLGLPLILVFGAAVLGRYPFEGRVLLFTVPLVYIIMARGIHALFCLPRGRGWARAAAAAGVVSIGMSSLSSSWNLFRKRQDFEESRPIMQAFARDYRPGDAIFLNRYAEWPFYIYGYGLGFNRRLEKGDAGWWRGQQWQGVKVGRIYDNLGNDQGADVAGWRYVYYVYGEGGQIVEALMDNPSEVHLLNEEHLFLPDSRCRVWIILIHYSPEVYDFVLSQMDRRGKRIKTLVRKRASLFLYDFSPQEEECVC